MVAPGEDVRRQLLCRARHHDPQHIADQGPWLVIAPHPDDEALGAGAFIAGVMACGGDVDIVFLTDGAGSHRGAPGWSAGRIANRRREEARCAAAMLGVMRRTRHLDWPDAAPFAPDDPMFVLGARKLTALCRQGGIRRIAVTWPGEAHCDHQAAALLAAVVTRRLHIPLFHYLVWGWTDTALADRMRGLRVHAIRTARHRPRQRLAMAQHRSQRGGRIWGGESFRLPRPILRLIDRSHSFLIEAPHAP